jgi:hypothetical protein
MLAPSRCPVFSSSSSQKQIRTVTPPLQIKLAIRSAILLGGVLAISAIPANVPRAATEQVGFYDSFDRVLTQRWFPKRGLQLLGSNDGGWVYANPQAAESKWNFGLNVIRALLGQVR